MLQGTRSTAVECIIYTNCQGPKLLSILRKSKKFNQLFRAKAFQNFCNEVPTDRELEICNLFIYQELSEKWDNASTNSIIKKLPPDCICFCIPKFKCELFWPFHCRNPFNKQNEGQIHGMFPYGDSKVFDLMTVKNKTPKQLAEEYASLDLSKIIDFDALLIKILNYYREHHNSRDYNFSSVFKVNLSHKHMFRSFNHPTNTVLLDVANTILEKFGLEKLKNKSISDLEDLGHDYNVPIHPYIISQFNLRYSNKKYNVNNKIVTFEKYIENYIIYALKNKNDND